jgi:hypothetical protein
MAVQPPITIGPDGSESFVLTFDLRAAVSVQEVAIQLPDDALSVRDVQTGSLLALQLDDAVRSAAFVLYRRPHNFPNPFAPGRETTRLSYVLAAAGAVTIDIYTLFGDLVWSESFGAGGEGGRQGRNEVVWAGVNGNGEAVRNGVYVCRVQGAGIDTRWKIAVAR